MLGALREHSARFNAIGIQLEPDVQRITYEHLGHPDGLIPSHRPLFTNYTFIIDLTKTEDALLKAMHHKTRYNIRVAQKHHVTVREDGSQKAFSTFLNLNRETYMRQGFYAHDETYHRTMWDVLSRAGIARLFTAVHEGKILAAWIVFLWKDTLYYPYGASSRINRHVMAPNLLLWELIRWGKSQNLKKFDLWGCLGPDPDPKDPWYGFHRFKEGYAPALVEYAGSFDYPIRPFFYRAYTYADTLRWGLLRLKRQVMHM
jgi:lipid II:glycine glycyltransferase (peptidoglycan interpeptide bridge formation enzyme)